MTSTVRIAWAADADTALPVPGYATAGAAGADLRANLAPGDRAAGLALAPRARALVPTGLRLAVPEGFEAQIRPRSGLARDRGVTVANAPGTIDADYRGPLGVLLVNLGTDIFIVAHGARIAQMVVAPVARAAFEVTDTLDATERGAGGFGSTDALE